MITEFQIEEVINRLSIQNFLELPVRLYQNVQNWFRPLDSEIETIFDPKKNKMFRRGNCCRCILKNSDGYVIGRVAAIIDNKTKEFKLVVYRRNGFFECIDHKEAAFALFDCCGDWLKKSGHLSDGWTNKFWRASLMVGFACLHRPLYGMPYSLPYYQNLFESYGFKTYFEQYTYKTLFSADSLSEIIAWKAKRIENNPDYSIVYFRKRNVVKFIKDFVHIYNKSWVSTIPGVDFRTEGYALDTFNAMESVLDERLLWFAYCKGESIGFFIMTPDMNEVLINSKGNLVC
jgi:hypothetical protein